MGEVTSLGEVHAEDGIAGFQEAEQDDLVRGTARMRLDVGIARTEGHAGAFHRQALDLIDKLTAGMEAGPWITFRGYVCGDHTLAGQDRRVCNA